MRDVGVIVWADFATWSVCQGTLGLVLRPDTFKTVAEWKHCILSKSVGVVNMTKQPEVVVLLSLTCFHLYRLAVSTLVTFSMGLLI